MLHAARRPCLHIFDLAQQALLPPGSRALLPACRPQPVPGSCLVGSRSRSGAMGEASPAAAEAVTSQLAATQLEGSSTPDPAPDPALDSGTVHPFTQTYGVTPVASIIGRPDDGLGLVGRTLRVGAWVKTGRGSKQMAFLEVNDGSCFDNLQVILPEELAAGQERGLKSVTPTGTSVLVQGELTRTPEGTTQKVELKASKLVWVGPCDNSAGEYPIAKTKTSLEFLREHYHLRARSNTIAAVLRVRHALAQATHQFFSGQGFLYLHTPIITASDCEGAGEMFQVTSLLGGMEEAGARPRPTPEKLAELEGRVTEIGDGIKALKEAKGSKTEIKAQVAKLTEAKEAVAQAQEELKWEGGLPRLAQGSTAINYAEDFFGKPAFLTVSGQLNGEYAACALSKIYTFGPTFRAEQSNTSRHLAEFWMIEPEMAFADLADTMNCAEAYVRHCCRHLLDHCRRDLEFFTKQYDGEALARLEALAASPFERCSYTRAVELLEAAIAGGKDDFEFPVHWGVDLASEHERYLTEAIFRKPVIVYDYPADIKAFYMRANGDGRTVAAMDVLVPKVGELVGGSQREERYEVLLEKMRAKGLPLEPYKAYLDIRKYGSVPHSGFGLGFERLILLATGMENIRDVIAFPRYPGHAEC